MLGETDLESNSFHTFLAKDPFVQIEKRNLHETHQSCWGELNVSHSPSLDTHINSSKDTGCMKHSWKVLAWKVGISVFSLIVTASETQQPVVI